MAVGELSTSYHPAPAYFDDVAPHLLASACCGEDYLLSDPIKTDAFRFFKQKTAYAILRSDWSSDVCSSD
eukprot:COSAG05_NODE_20790_length_277_cov_0.286517_1_plen_69_part_01